MTLHATLDIARRVDRAEIDFCASFGDAGTPAGVESLEAGGGRALYLKPGAPLNKMLGLGLNGPVSDDDLDRVEAFYAKRQCPAQIELCPLAYADVAARLCARGFVVQGYENQLGRTLDPRSAEALRHLDSVRSAEALRHLDSVRHPDSVPAGPDSVGSVAQPFRAAIEVSRVTPEEDELWMRITAEGFAAAEAHVGGGPHAELPTSDQMVGMMAGFVHPSIRRYLAWSGDEPAGGGGSTVQDGVLFIFGTATLAPFRRRGLQTAITRRAIEEAGGAELASATVAPGSTSQRTFERLGFQVLYTRTVFVKA